MVFRMTVSDCDVLRTIMECRLVTIPQLAVLLSRNAKGLQKRLNQLIAEGLLMEMARGPGQRRGRPERVVSATARGVDVLRERGLIDPQVPTEVVLGERLPPQAHQLLLNWIRAHLHHVATVLPQLNIQFLAQNSPFLPQGSSNLSIVTGPAPGEVTRQRSTRLEPDAALSICDTTQDKTVLFFLEVDRDTETLASPKRKPSDIRQKILNYGIYFDTYAYKKYGCNQPGAHG